MPDIDRVQRLAQELRQRAVELEEYLSVLRDEIDASSLAADQLARLDKSRFAKPLEAVSESPCEPRIEGGDAA